MRRYSGPTVAAVALLLFVTMICNVDGIHTERGRNNGGVLNDDVVANLWDTNNRPSRATAGALEVPRQRFREALYASQHPSDCHSVSLCTCGHPTGYTGGLFSLLHLRAECLLYAFVSNCTLVDAPDWKEYVFTEKGEYVTSEECDIPSLTSPFECYFQPISSCSVTSVLDTEQLLTKQKCSTFYQRFGIIARKFGLESPLLAKSELLSFAMRPNDVLTASVKRWASNMTLSSSLARSRCLAVHIRHTDKRGVPKSEKHRTAFVGAANDIRKLYGYNVVNFMTDDPSVEELFDLFPKKAKGVRAITLPTPPERQGQQGVGLRLITQAILMAQCEMLLGSQVSG